MPDAAAVAGMLVNLMLIASSLCCKKSACLQGAQSAVRENASFRQIAGIMCDTILAVLSGVAIGFAGLLISEVAMLHMLVLFRYSVVAANLSALAFGIQVVIAALSGCDAKQRPMPGSVADRVSASSAGPPIVHPGMRQDY
jgi:hypothetical protein